MYGTFAGGTTLLLSRLVNKRAAWKLSSSLASGLVLFYAYVGAKKEANTTSEAKAFLGRMGIPMPPRKAIEHRSILESDGFLLAGAIGGAFIASLRSKPWAITG
jgi:hypothetical protein